MTTDVIYSINGPVVKVKDTTSFSMLEMVHVGHAKLLGEVIVVTKEFTTIQVYETTSGLRPGEPVYSTKSPISATLGPGILSNIFDGVQRPLEQLEKDYGPFLEAGSTVDAINRETLWDVTIIAQNGQYLQPGDIYATTPETDLIIHKCMVPPTLSGTVVKVVTNGNYKVDDCIVVLEDDCGTRHNLTLVQKWPIKKARPIKNRKACTIPLLTGQRVIDTMFPIAKGGTAAIPGGFGTGKTMTQHQIAKWCDADIIVYIGCGERGNEMTQVLEEFRELIDPKSNKPLTDRTILIANTSNMPVAAREASIYTGITLAEYYRDMGYHVAIMADSTSRWAEALREISGRLEEMPVEEGFPAYLPSRLSQFYERAGYMENLNGSEGSVSIIGAVSPQGADFSEPVTQNTKRFVRCFWALDKSLAYMRHYFAINWMESYSEYIYDFEAWYEKNVSFTFSKKRQELAFLLAKEAKLNEIVKLMGNDVLPEDQKLVMETAKLIRVGFLQQNAFHKEDTYVPLVKQDRMMEVILYLHQHVNNALKQGKTVRAFIETGIFDKVIKMKYDIKNNELEKFDEYLTMIDDAIMQVQ